MRGLEKTHMESSVIKEPHSLPVSPPQRYLGFKGLWLTQGRNAISGLKIWTGQERPACPVAEAWVKGERISQKLHWS